MEQKYKSGGIIYWSKTYYFRSVKSSIEVLLSYASEKQNVLF